MTKVIEILFRNKGKLLALLLLPILVSGVVVFFLPRTYQATARLWALHRYAVVSATGIESDLQSTEAMTQATALNEFLQTKSFDWPLQKIRILRNTWVSHNRIRKTCRMRSTPRSRRMWW